MGAHDSSLENACGCGGGETIAPRCGGTLPDNPDCGNNYHFGMLLGEADFRADQGFHLGHHRRHQRLLHGYGVVHGYRVHVPQPEAGKPLLLRVEPGFAVDALGRDLFLDEAQCLDVAKWWEKHRGDDIFADAKDLAEFTFRADVLLCYRTCLARPVPAIADPCAGTSADIAYSRICESVQLTLAPRTAGDADDEGEPAVPYRELRVFFGLEAAAAGDEWIADGRKAVDEAPQDERAALADTLWRKVIARAAANTANAVAVPVWKPPRDPGDDSGTDTRACLVIARLAKVHVRRGPDGWTWDLAAGDIDMDARMTLVPTQALQQILFSSRISI